jgi:hypothetical protein
MQESQIIRNYLIPLEKINLKISGAIEACIKMDSNNPKDYMFRSISTSVIDDNLLVVVVFDV